VLSSKHTLQAVVSFTTALGGEVSLPSSEGANSPFGGWIQNLIGNIESARQGLIDSGLCDSAQLAKAITELTDLSRQRDASSHFMWNRAVAIR
jgi:hypothetical protein